VPPISVRSRFPLTSDRELRGARNSTSQHQKLHAAEGDSFVHANIQRGRGFRANFNPLVPLNPFGERSSCVRPPAFRARRPGSRGSAISCSARNWLFPSWVQFPLRDCMSIYRNKRRRSRRFRLELLESREFGARSDFRLITSRRSPPCIRHPSPSRVSCCPDSNFRDPREPLGSRLAGRVDAEDVGAGGRGLVLVGVAQRDGV
jgi:hypothetical protein